MANTHVLEQLAPGRFRVVYHVAIPATNNAGGVACGPTGREDRGADGACPLVGSAKRAGRPARRRPRVGHRALRGGAFPRAQFPGGNAAPSVPVSGGRRTRQGGAGLSRASAGRAGFHAGPDRQRTGLPRRHPAAQRASGSVWSGTGSALGRLVDDFVTPRRGDPTRRRRRTIRALA